MLSPLILPSLLPPPLTVRSIADEYVLAVYDQLKRLPATKFSIVVFLDKKTTIEMKIRLKFWIKLLLIGICLELFNEALLAYSDFDFIVFLLIFLL